MAYQAIYRKWRPLVFEDIVGQSHVTQTLKNQILTGKIGHAYLFCGTRGTGKTTAAKVFARAVNCVSNTTGSPCNECEICRGIADGSILDVTEIDAASNNGVDSIREIREDTKYVAALAKYRIYIIDEVHMLSTGAFNALLKTLEEPPEHVIFILATTEAHKVPQTILSRCQRFDFKRIRPSDIIVRLKEIAYGDGLSISEDGYHMLARLADGSMRDALSILERVVSSCGSEITGEDITKTLGIAAIDTEFDMADAMIEANAQKVFELMNRLMEEGRDLPVFIDALMKHFRDLLVCKLSQQPENLMDYGPEELVRFRAQAEKVSYEKISNVIDTLNTAKADAKWLKAPRVIYELALVKLCVPELDDSPQAVMDRLQSVEEKLKNGVTVKVEEKKETEKKPEPEPEKKEKKVSKRLYNPIPAADLHSENPIVIAAKKWDRIVQTVTKSTPHLLTVLTNRPITVDADGIILMFDKNTEAMFKSIADSFRNTIETGFEKASGVHCVIKNAFKQDIEDVAIDFWSLKPPAQEAKTDAPGEEPEQPQNADPLDRLAEAFPEIVEMTDDSEFLEYDAAEDNFSQSSFEEKEEEDREEEFLEESELDGE